ncbi:MAG TPA: hypothetical protein VHC90_05615 [Bryobacteraceae bacterium]|nr:hypothetical protein [Bryobacteraceae bacterium]
MKCLSAVASPAPRTSKGAAAQFLGDLWCKLTHSAIRWPVHGQYMCAKCGRSYPVPWANVDSSTTAENAHAPFLAH